MSSRDGGHWSPWQRLATIERGHYQVSAVGRARPGTAFNYHPQTKGANWRTNLYYMETPDFGASWHAADGTPLHLPLSHVNNPALVHDYAAEGLNVYLKDIRYDEDDRPVALYLTSKGPLPGPSHGPRIWWTARGNGRQCDIRRFTTPDNNYDMGSLWIESDGTWRIIAPTEPGPRRYNTGGEVVMWTSSDRGQTWRGVQQLTRGSARNHTYVRRSVRAHADFCALWAAGDGRQPSASRLYFCNKQGEVFVLAASMDRDYVRPQRLSVLAP